MLCFIQLIHTMPFLYKITCPDEYFYIGKAKQPMKRLKQHYSNRLRSEDSFDAYIQKFSFDDLKIEILKECSEETINQEENEAIILAKYDLKTGKANPKNLNLMIDMCLINKLANLEVKDYWDIDLRKLKGTEYKYLLELAIEYGRSKVVEKNINRHDDLIICSFCNRFYKQSQNHILCTEESCKNAIDIYIQEHLQVEDKVQARKNLREYLKGFREYRESIQLEIDLKQAEINQWKANLEHFHTSIYDPKKAEENTIKSKI